MNSRPASLLMKLARGKEQHNSLCGQVVTFLEVAVVVEPLGPTDENRDTVGEDLKTFWDCQVTRLIVLQTQHGWTTWVTPCITWFTPCTTLFTSCITIQVSHLVQLYNTVHTLYNCTTWFTLCTTVFCNID